VFPKRVWLLVAIGLGLVPLVWFVAAWITYPSERTPEGAYLRIVAGVNRGRPEDFFPYIEAPAQNACFTIRDYRRSARQRVLSSYPEPERSRLAAEYEAEAEALDGSDVFALYAHRRRWLDRLRRDMSGIARVQIDAERATIETVNGTRYPLRLRENGIWGLTLFTATLVAEANKAARDYSMIEEAAADYERAKKRAD
jgi:hypothetical protein